VTERSTNRAGLHDDATRLLTMWEPPDADQSRLRSDFLRHLADRADAMWRSCVPAHLTTGLLIMSADHRRVLLTLHRRVRLWLQTGGHCEANDATVSAAALREGREESGIDGLPSTPCRCGWPGIRRRAGRTARRPISTCSSSPWRRPKPSRGRVPSRWISHGST
jgi:8-oxo-dGTP pyrophosphatase MutT (NUDIX family)